MSVDLITLGETMIRLTPPGFDRIEQANSFEIHIGGSESNTAVGLARLGSRVIWLSRLPGNPLGRRVAATLASHGVDVTHVEWSTSDRMGTYYLERGKAPRAAQVYYDRAESAASRMTPSCLPSHLFVSGNAKMFHTTGITLGISTSAAQTALKAVELAQKAGWQIAFDVNYRAKLWSPNLAKEACSQVMQHSDLVFLPNRDARTVFGVEIDDDASALSELAAFAPKATIVMTVGSRGSIARKPSGEIVAQSAIPTMDIERLGSGDAFTAGFMHRYLTDAPLGDCLLWGTAMASLKYTIPGDLPVVSRTEVESLIRSSSEGTSASGLDIQR